MQKLKHLHTRYLSSFFIKSIIVLSLLGVTILLLPGQASAHTQWHRHWYHSAWTMRYWHRYHTRWTVHHRYCYSVRQPIPPHSMANAVLYDITHHRYYTYNASSQFIAASSIKVPIMLAFLDRLREQKRKPDRYEMRLLTTMIEDSNNASASILYQKVGGAVGTMRFLRKIGISGLQPDAGSWGYSLVTPRAMVNLLTRLYEGHILTEHDRHLALTLMGHVQTNQRTGVGNIAPGGATIAMKDGWVPGPDGFWAVNSSGIVTTDRITYIISVYTKEEPSLQAGWNTVRQICHMMVSRLKQ